MENAASQYIVWKPEYAVGNDAIDAQHQKMFAIINNVYSQMRAGLSNDEMHHLLEAAHAYAQKHFRSEEDAMRSYGYPDLEIHQREHRKYEQEVRSLMRRQARQVEPLAYDLLSFLKNWWQEHVTNRDQQYAPCLERPDPSHKSDAGGP
jgi:hemerythrin